MYIRGLSSLSFCRGRSLAREETWPRCHGARRPRGDRESRIRARRIRRGKIPLIASKVINFPLAVHDSSPRLWPRVCARAARSGALRGFSQTTSPAMLIFSLIRRTRKRYRTGSRARAAIVGVKMSRPGVTFQLMFTAVVWEDVHRLTIMPATGAKSGNATGFARNPSWMLGNVRRVSWAFYAKFRLEI